MEDAIDDISELMRSLHERGEFKLTLRLKSEGPVSAAVQDRLSLLGYELTADGQYGPQTKAAVTAFQESVGLKGDGLCGAKTFSALFDGAAVA